MSSIVKSSATAHQPLGRSVAVSFLPSPHRRWKMGSLQYTFHFGEQKKNHRVPNPRIWRMFNYWNAFIGKKLLHRKGVVCWGIVLMQHPYVVLPEIRPLLPQNLSHCLFVNTHHVCNHSHTQASTFANNFTDFLNVLVSFEIEGRPGCSSSSASSRPSLNLLCHSNPHERDIKLSPYTSFNNLMHSAGDVSLISQEISD